MFAKNVMAVPKAQLKIFGDPPLFGYIKFNDPSPNCTSPPPSLINDRSLMCFLLLLTLGIN